MLIKSKSIIQRIFATFLILSLTLCYFTIGVSAADYSESNDTVYVAADYWGLEELPFGVNTGVVQFQYNEGYLTLYFDRLSIFDKANYDTIGVDFESMYSEDHYWKVLYDDTSGKLDYLFSCTSDSPIYYKTTYSANGSFSSTIGQLSSSVVPFYMYFDGDPVQENIAFKVFTLEDYRLSNLVPDWTIDISLGSRRVYSNCFQIDATSNIFYYPYRASGPTNWINGKNVGYNIKYYPSVEYLQNVSLRDSILDEFFKVRTELIDINNYLYNGNVYLEQMSMYLANIDTMTQSIQFLLDVYLPLLNYNLGEILTKLDEIKTGPEYDSSQGIGSNTEFGDAVGGLIGNTEVPDSGVNTIKNDLRSSFLLIRNVFETIVFDWFPLGYVITFLLGLSFIAYVLGRVIKNKMR